MQSLKNLTIKDIPCSQCFKKKSLGSQYPLFCTRLGMECDKARRICVKTRWYVQLCTITARVDKAVYENRAE